MSRRFALLLPALLAGCDSSPSENAKANDVDPAITSALGDPLMADPNLDRRSNNGALRPADAPYQAMVPPGVPDPLRGGAGPTVLSRLHPAMANGFAGCRFDVAYSYGWAARLSADLDLPPQGQVAEAAGSDAPKCALRLVAYSAPLAPDAVLDSYRGTAKAGGFSASEKQSGGVTVLTATRARDGAAFVASISPSSGGSAVDLADNRGR